MYVGPPCTSKCRTYIKFPGAATALVNIPGALAEYVKILGLPSVYCVPASTVEYCFSFPLLIDWWVGTTVFHEHRSVKPSCCPKLAISYPFTTSRLAVVSYAATGPGSIVSVLSMPGPGCIASAVASFRYVAVKPGPGCVVSVAAPPRIDRASCLGLLRHASAVPFKATYPHAAVAASRQIYTSAMVGSATVPLA